MTSQTATCSIVIEGPIDGAWADYFGDLVLSAQVHDGEINTTMLSGPIPDLAAFIGLVTRVYNRGLPVMSAQYQSQSIREDQLLFSE